MPKDKKVPDESRRHDQRSPAGKFLDGVRGFVDEHIKAPGREMVKDAMAGKSKRKEK